MKKTFFLSLFSASLAIGFVACNSEGDGNNEADTTTTTTSTTTTTENSGLTTNTSTVDYAAMADTFRMGNNEGRYLDPRTGKSIKINVDPQTGRRTNAATGEPVWRYVDRKTWWVYGGDDWQPQGEARMEGSTLRYRGDNDAWLNYEERWPNDQTMMSEWKTKSGDGTKTEVERDGDTKTKNDNIKVKTEKDGDIKIKTEDGTKIKKDEDGVRVKKDGSK